VRFWDASAIVPLLQDEPRSATSHRLFREDRGVVVWTLTRVEALSALCRKRRQGTIDEASFARGRRKLAALSQHWHEIDDLHAVRAHAERFLAEHPLRAGDALQLGAAWLHADGRPKRRRFVVFDGPLLEAAEKAGFTVVSADA